MDSDMTWQNISDERPGFSMWRTKIGDRTFLAQKKQDLGFWRLFVKENESDPLRMIFGPTSKLKDCKEYAEKYDRPNP